MCGPSVYAELAIHRGSSGQLVGAHDPVVSDSGQDLDSSRMMERTDAVLMVGVTWWA